MDYTNTQQLPFNYVLAVLSLSLLFIEAYFKQKQAWILPALAVYFTIGMWYLAEVIYTPEKYISFSREIVEASFFQVLIFLAAFRLMVPAVVKKIAEIKTSKLPSFSFVNLSADKILYVLAFIWFVLLLFGLSQVNWRFLEALFPVGGRNHSTYLFTRAAVGKSTDFITSAMGYIYNLICSFFGVLYFFQKKPNAKIFNILLIVVSWPMFMLSGTRSAFLATVVPAVMTYLFVSKNKWWLKATIAGVCFSILNYILTLIITYRNVGYESILSTMLQTGKLIEIPVESKHDGLNMAEELFYINSFLKQRLVSLTYGYDYLIELLNFIPRFLWVDKPFIGLEYARLRVPSANSMGIEATVSRGIIGGGVLNFGEIFGPIFSALLMSIWSGIIARLWMQRQFILRFALFLVAIGITPNLGRDFSLLVLWPMVFGYFLVIIIERLEKNKIRRIQLD